MPSSIPYHWKMIASVFILMGMRCPGLLYPEQGQRQNSITQSGVAERVNTFLFMYFTQSPT